MRGRTVSRHRRSTLAAALALALVGCADKPAANQKPTHAVRGRVLLEGRPVGGATVVFYPTGGGADAVKSYARTDTSGYFTLSTYKLNDGAPEGKYDVTALLYDDGEGVHRLPSRYASPKTTDIRVEIKAGDNDLRPFNLRANPGS